MSSMKKLAKQSSHYLLGEVLITLSGFISFPIFTRIFTRAEYGIMSLVTVTLVLTEMLINGGLRTSVVRFYGEFKDGKRQEELGMFCSTLITASIFLGIIGTTLLFSAKYIIPPNLVNKEVLDLLSFAAFLIFFRMISQLVLNIYRVEEKTIFINIVKVSEKYLGLVFALIFVLFFKKRLYGLYGGLLIAEGFFSLFLLFLMLKKYGRGIFKFSKKILNEALQYGMPLLGQNFSGLVNDSGDKFMIGYFLDQSQVGIYSVGYSLATYVQTAIGTPFNSAVVPIVMNTWAKNGKQETEKFLSKALLYYSLIAIPVIFGVVALGKEILLILATSKFEAAAIVIPWVITGTMLNGGFFIVMAGLYLYKKTGTIALLLCMAAIVNVLLNLFFIPTFGILGAAITTVISYLVYVISGAIVSSKYLKIKIPFMDILKYVLLSAIMYAMLISIHCTFCSRIFNVIVKFLIGISTYVGLLLIFDKNFRERLQGLKNRINQRNVKLFSKWRKK